MNKNAHAFTLIEVMIASAIFLATVAGVTSAIAASNHLYEHQRRLTQAVSIAEFVMEELLLRYSTHEDLDVNATASASGAILSGTPRYVCLTAKLATTTCSATSSSGGTAMTVTSTIGSKYVAYWLVSRPPNVSGLKQINLVVTWFEQGGQKSLPFMTYRP